jgi:hypothetical protein
MVTDPGALEVVKMIVSLAHRLGLRCIAEGIETREQLVLLRAMGCDEGQGFLLARPMAAGDLADVLAGALPWQPLFASMEAAESPPYEADQVCNAQLCAYWTDTAPRSATVHYSKSRLERSAMPKPATSACNDLRSNSPCPEGGVCRIA